MAESQHAEAAKQAAPERVERAREPGGEELGAPLQRAVAPIFQGGRIDPRRLTPQAILALQRTAGNAVVNELLRPEKMIGHMDPTEGWAPARGTLPIEPIQRSGRQPKITDFFHRVNPAPQREEEDDEDEDAQDNEEQQSEHGEAEDESEAMEADDEVVRLNGHTYVLHTSDAYVTARLGENTIGTFQFGQLNEDGEEVDWLAHMNINEAHRRHGLGAAMMAFAVRVRPFFRVPTVQNNSRFDQDEWYLTDTGASAITKWVARGILPRTYCRP